MYKHCTADSLHSPSKFMVDVVQACQKKFNETFALSRHRKNILGRMFSLSEAEVGKMPEVAEGSLFDCQVETIKKVIGLFLRVLLYHNIKLLNRSLKNKAAGKRNRKAQKVMHT